MQSRTPFAAAAVALLAVLALAAPAMAKPVAYKGKTAGGYEITFKRSGNALVGAHTMLPTSCVPSLGGAATRAGAELFQPPARLPIGREFTTSALQDATMHYADVTKNYRVTVQKGRNGLLKGRLHLNFSYQTIHYGYELMLVGYVCQGDDTFKARPVKR